MDPIIVGIILTLIVIGGWSYVLFKDCKERNRR